MNEEIDKREHRLKVAEHQSNTSRQWDLVAAVVEAAVITHYKMGTKDARAMRGRSQVKIIHMNKDSLDMEKVDNDIFDAALSRSDWPK